MKRKYASEVIKYLAKNIEGLVQSGVVHKSNINPPLLLGTLKFRMCVHANYLNELFLWLTARNFENLSSFEASKEMEDIYRNSTESYFEKPLQCRGNTFNSFWDDLLSKKNIPHRNIGRYEKTKIQTYLVWQAMHVLYPSYLASDTTYYQIQEDILDDILSEVSCKNKLLDHALKMMCSDQYIPQSITIENSTAPVIHLFKPFMKGNRPVPPVAHFHNKTEGDVWFDGFVMSKLKQFEVLNRPVLLYHVENDLAQTLANLMATYLMTIEVLGSEYDFYNRLWDLDALTQSEIEKLNVEIEKLQRDNSKIIDTILSQQISAESNAKTNENLSEENLQHVQSNREKEKVYSNNIIEAGREAVGESLKEYPVQIPTRLQKERYQDCRWIIPNLSLIEVTIRNWKEACQNERLGFWNPIELRDGLYYLEDGQLIKDPEKTYSRIRKGSASPSYRLR